MSFYPEGATVPEERRTERLLLRPLRATDVALDYDAVMSSPEMLRRWSQGTWPADDFTLAGNLADLERHEREHHERVAFTFTVLSPDEKRCLGCVYFTPVGPEAATLCPGAEHATQVGFWVRASEIASDLDRHLLATVRGWLKTAWAFDRVLFAISQQDARQVTLLRDIGLDPGSPLTLSDGRACRAFVEGIRRPDPRQLG